MLVGVMRLEFQIPHARSLKDKRAVVRKFAARVRARHEVSIAEVGYQDLHQRAAFGVAVVSSEASVIDSMLEAVAREASVQPDAILMRRSSELVAMGDEHFLDALESTDGRG